MEGVTSAKANGDRGDLLGVQAGNLIGELARAQVPEAQSTVKVPRHHREAVHGQPHAVHTGVADERACTEAPPQVPHLSLHGHM